MELLLLLPLLLLGLLPITEDCGVEVALGCFFGCFEGLVVVVPVGWGSSMESSGRERRNASKQSESREGIVGMGCGRAFSAAPRRLLNCISFF